MCEQVSESSDDSSLQLITTWSEDEPRPTKSPKRKIHEQNKSSLLPYTTKFGRLIVNTVVHDRNRLSTLFRVTNYSAVNFFRPIAFCVYLNVSQGDIYKQCGWATVSSSERIL